MNNKRVGIYNMRLIGDDHVYHQHQLQQFANSTPDSVVGVEFGKQDTRGGFSICFYNDRHCVDKQVFFRNKDEMLGYVQGFNAAREAA